MRAFVMTDVFRQDHFAFVARSDGVDFGLDLFRDVVNCEEVRDGLDSLMVEGRSDVGRDTFCAGKNVVEHGGNVFTTDTAEDCFLSR